MFPVMPKFPFFAHCFVKCKIRFICADKIMCRFNNLTIKFQCWVLERF